MQVNVLSAAETARMRDKLTRINAGIAQTSAWTCGRTPRPNSPGFARRVGLAEPLTWRLFSNLKDTMSTSSIANVTVNTQASVYFDGKCVSHGITFADGTKKSVGVVLPSTLTFNTGAPEIMECVAGSCEYKLAGTDAWLKSVPGDNSASPATHRSRFGWPRPTLHLPISADRFWPAGLSPRPPPAATIPPPSPPSLLSDNSTPPKLSESPLNEPSEKLVPQ